MKFIKARCTYCGRLSVCGGRDGWRVCSRRACERQFNADVDRELLGCVACGEVVTQDDGAECSDCGAAVFACQSCMDAGAWLTCTPCFDLAHNGATP